MPRRRALPRALTSTHGLTAARSLPCTAPQSTFLGASVASKAPAPRRRARAAKRTGTVAVFGFGEKEPEVWWMKGPLFNST